MRKILVAFLLFSANVQAQTTYPSGVTGCIARYTFSGTSTASIADSSGNNHPITFTNNLTSAPGFRNQAGTAMKFNGINSTARANPSTQFNLSNVSIVALIKFTGFYSGNCQGNTIVNRGNGNFSAGTWGMEVNDQGYDNSCSLYSPGYDQLGFVGPSPGGNPPAGNYLDSNKWYLLVTTYDGSTAVSYQILMDTTARLTSLTSLSSFAMPGPLGTNNDSLYIGYNANAQYPYWLHADVDELVLFNKALTNTDIKSIYDYLFGHNLGVGNQELLNNASVAIVNNRLQVHNPVQGAALQMTVFDMAGTKLYSGSSSAASATVDMERFAAGVYVVRLTCKGAAVMKKVIKQ